MNKSMELPVQTLYIVFTDAEEDGKRYPIRALFAESQEAESFKDSLDPKLNATMIPYKGPFCITMDFDGIEDVEPYSLKIEGTVKWSEVEFN